MKLRREQVSYVRSIVCKEVLCVRKCQVCDS
jgi:hypothetical protein